MNTQLITIGIGNDAKKAAKNFVEVKNSKLENKRYFVVSWITIGETPNITYFGVKRVLNISKDLKLTKEQIKEIKK